MSRLLTIDKLQPALKNPLFITCKACAKTITQLQDAVAARLVAEEIFEKIGTMLPLIECNDSTIWWAKYEALKQRFLGGE